MGNERDFFLRGNPFLYEEFFTRFIIRWKEEVCRSVLQSSVKEVIRKSPWIRYTLINRERSPQLALAQGEFTVYDQYHRCQTSQNAAGYLFFVSCERDIIHFDIDHFLTDGHGYIWMISEVLSEYCNRMYGTDIPYSPLESKTLPSFDEILRSYRPEADVKSSPSEPFSNNHPYHLLLRLKKKDVVQRAVEFHVKPFSFLSYLFCLSVMGAKGKTEISYSFAVDARKAFGSDDVFYNFCWPSTQTVALANDLSQSINDINNSINGALIPGIQEAGLSRYLYSLDSLSKMNTTHAVKKKVYAKMSAAERTEVGISYLGSAFPDKYLALRQYVSDFHLSAAPKQIESFFLSVTLKDEIITNITHHIDNQKLIENLSSVIGSNSIQISELSKVEA